MDINDLNYNQINKLYIFEKIYKDAGIEMLKMEFMRVITFEQFEQVYESLLSNYELLSLTKGQKPS